MMFPRSRSILLFFILLLGVFLITAQPATACSCNATPTVLDSYDRSDVVMIGRVISVEKVSKDSADRPYVDDVRTTTILVERVFKGNVKVRDELIFGQGGGADCIWTFNEAAVGFQFLFYLNDPKTMADRSYLPSKEPGLWFAGTCGRSSGLPGATDDLLYLENMSKVRGKTRISGTIGGWQNPDLNVEGRKVRIIGANKTYETKTDKHGVFEIYDLPPGKYFVEAETPPGWKIDPYWTRYSSSLVREESGQPELKSSRQIAIMLAAKRHAGVDIVFTIDNVVRGKVIDPNGKPMHQVCVYLWRRDQVDGFGPSDCTDKNGKFEIGSIPSGEYVLVANNDGKLSSREPFETFYYPSVSDRDKAAVITIAAGDAINDLNLIVPQLKETVNIQGVVRYSDGKPVIEEWVKFKPINPANNITGEVSEKTDSEGRFSMKILKGLKGELTVEEWVWSGLFENCPKVEELIKKSGSNSTTLKSNVIEIQADDNIFNLELTLPFSPCKRREH